MLKFEISQEEFEALDEGQQALYDKHGDGYRLQVEGIDPADELKEALRKEREDRAEAKRRLQELEETQTEAERRRLEEKEEYQTLYQKEQERRTSTEKELAELRDKVANSTREGEAAAICAALIDKEAAGGVQRFSLLKKEAMQYIAHTPEGVKINGPDGEAWTAKQLGEHLSNEYPFLVDGSKASGGGAPGSSGGGAVRKKLKDMNQDERMQWKQEDPEGFRKALNRK